MKNTTPPPPPPPPHNFNNNDLRIICDELMALKAENHKIQEILASKIFWNVFWANISSALFIFIVVRMILS